MIPQGPEDLPDDTLLDDVVLTGRARHIAGQNNIKTVGDLRKLSDAEVLRFPNSGKMALLEFRLLTGQLKPGALKRKSDEISKAEWVRTVAAGQCKCSFEDWRKEQAR